MTNGTSESLKIHYPSALRYGASLFFAISMAAGFALLNHKLPWAAVPAFGAAFVVFWFVVLRVIAAIGPRKHAALGLLALLIIGAGVGVVLHRNLPLNRGPVGGDRDEALETAAHAIVHGHYPYYFHTGVALGWDNVISNWPGSILLGMPFALLTDVGWQNLAWVMVAALFSLRRSATPLVVPAALVMILATPTVLGDMKVGSDLVVNGFYFATAVAILIRATDPWKTTHVILASAFLGITVSSRAPYFIMLLPVSLFFVHRLGVRRTFVPIGTAILVAAAITAPFYLYDPSEFGPSRVSASIAGRWRHILPRSDLILPMISVAWIVLRRKDLTKFAGLMAVCAEAVVLPVLTVFILAIIDHRRGGVTTPEGMIFWLDYSLLGIGFAFYLMTSMGSEIFARHLAETPQMRSAARLSGAQAN
jgi:hypothetical protein